MNGGSRRRPVSQAMAPSSASSGRGRDGGGGGDAPGAKRARLDLDRSTATLQKSNDQICSGGRGGTASSAAAAASASTLVVLPIDLLTSSFLYLDVGDVPSASATCRDWNAALKSVEDQLWLGLVRKHCPAVEEITSLLELTPRKAAAANGIEAGQMVAMAGGGGGGGGGIPSPSKSWRRQFQRHLLLSRSADSNDAAAASDKPPPKPLSAYLFKIDLVLYQKEEGAAGKGDQVGVVSRVFSDAKENASRDGKPIEFKMVGIHEELKTKTFSSFDFRVTVYEKSTGRQALIHFTGIEDCWDDNTWLSGYFPMKSAYILDGLVNPEDRIESSLSVGKSGCAKRCGHDEDFYDERKISCACCSCDEKWSCSWDFDVGLRIAACFDWEVVDLDEEQKLRFFEDHVEFK